MRLNSTHANNKYALIYASVQCEPVHAIIKCDLVQHLIGASMHRSITWFDFIQPQHDRTLLRRVRSCSAMRRRSPCKSYVNSSGRPQDIPGQLVFSGIRPPINPFVFKFVPFELWWALILLEIIRFTPGGQIKLSIFENLRLPSPPCKMPNVYVESRSAFIYCGVKASREHTKCILLNSRRKSFYL